VKKIENFTITNNISKKTNSKKFTKSTFFNQKIFQESLIGNKNFFQYFHQNYKLNFARFNKFKKFKQIVIVGMGGSSLGANAIKSFLIERIKKDIIFFDNLDELKLYNFDKSKKFGKFLFIIISKSGNTLETILISNFLNSKYLKKNNTIIITEDNNNALNSFAKKRNFEIVKHNPTIGGRYSVLSEVAMLPAFLMGLKIDKFKKGILSVTKKNKSKLFLGVNEMVKKFQSKKYSSLVLLSYHPRLEQFLFWYQQLFAESLGKKGNGLLPVVSSTPKDHHSLLQLYLDGPKDKIFYFFSIDESSGKKLKNNFFGSKFNILSQKSLSEIARIQKDSLIDVFERKKIPFREFKITSTNEESLAELFSFFMLETFLIGKKLKINPFDQPAVEEVKKRTFQRLKNRTK
tara:strand:- start:1024 stop:2235 length:1212 start_codon:yes stop_codon:yes gene_type:complete